jgi:hypothetical protein
MAQQASFLMTLEDGQPIRGMLADLIHEKAAAYVEPQRKGTPRGQEVGFPLKKYIATLVELTNIPAKQVAEKLGVSFGLLRKWKTERRYWMLVGEHHQELSRRYWDYIKDYTNREWATLEEMIQLSPNDFAATEIKSFLIEPIFNDSFLYNRSMSPALNPFGRQGSKLTDKECAVVFAGIEILQAVGWMAPKNPEREREQAIKWIPSMLSELRELFTRENLTDDDKRRGIIVLQSIQRDLRVIGVEPPKVSVTAEPKPQSPTRKKRKPER